MTASVLDSVALAQAKISLEPFSYMILETRLPLASRRKRIVGQSVNGAHLIVTVVGL